MFPPATDRAGPIMEAILVYAVEHLSSRLRERLMHQSQ